MLRLGKGWMPCPVGAGKEGIFRGRTAAEVGWTGCPGSEGRALKNYSVLSTVVTTVVHGAEMHQEENGTLKKKILLNRRSLREFYDLSLSKTNCGDFCSYDSC